MEAESNGREFLPFVALQAHINKLGLTDLALSKELGYASGYIASLKQRNKVPKSVVIAAEGLVRRTQGARFTSDDKDLEILEKVRSAIKLLNEAQGKLQGKLKFTVEADRISADFRIE
jgi:hypothetical protein